MKRLSLIFVLSSLAFGQGVVLPTQQALKVVNGVTSPVANATITVCAANASGIPCAPALVSAIFKDAALTQPLTNPFTSDANGNYVFAIAPGNYTVTVTAATFTGYSYQTTAPLSASSNNTYTGSNTFSGAVNLNGGGSLSGTFGGSFTHTGVLTQTGAVTVGTENSVIWVDGVKYTTIASAIAACPANGCQIKLPPGYRETFTSTITLGNGGNQFMKLYAYTNVILTCNINDGGSGTTACITVSEGSGIEGVVVGAGSGGFNSGIVIKTTSTTNVQAVVQTDLTEGAAGGQGSFMLRNFEIYPDVAATIRTACLNIDQTFNINTLENIEIISCPVKNVRIASNSAHESGPFVLQNLWSNCGQRAGCINLSVEAKNGHPILGLDIVGGNFSGPGASTPAILLDATGSTGPLMRRITIHTYIDDSNHTSSGTVLGVKIINAQDVDLSGLFCNLMDTNTCVDINQDGAGKTFGIHAAPVMQLSPTNGATLVNNHISGEVITGDAIASYNFAGDSTSVGGGGVQPYTVSGNETLFKNFSGQTFSDIQPNTSAPFITHNNQIDNTFPISTSSGKTATQFISYILQDRGTNEWSFGKDSGNGFFVNDALNNKSRFNLTQLTTPALTGDLKEATTGCPLGWRNNGNTADILLCKNASDQLTFNAVVVTQTIASGTATMTTAAIGAGACGTTVTVAAANVATTDTITTAFNAAPAGTNAGLTSWPTSGNVNFAYCPGVAETPAAATINWRVVR